MKKGKFIVFEGLDLSGKSTLIRHLKDKKANFVYTREPGGTKCELAESIRDFVLSYPTVMDPITEAYLFAASRAAHVNEINEWLSKGNTVVCDRFLYSSLYYQGVMKELGVDKVKEINQNAVRDLVPDLIIYVTVSEEERMRRFKARSDEINSLDIQSFQYSCKKNEDEYFSVVLDNAECPIKVIDTTNCHTEEHIEQIVRIIESL